MMGVALSVGAGWMLHQAAVREIPTGVFALSRWEASTQYSRVTKPSSGGCVVSEEDMRLPRNPVLACESNVHDGYVPLDQQGVPVADSLTTAIYLRN